MPHYFEVMLSRKLSHCKYNENGTAEIIGFFVSIQGVSTKFQYFFHDFSMTKALKSKNFYMLHGMKEPCNHQEDVTGRFCL